MAPYTRAVEGDVRASVLAAGPEIWRPAGQQEAPPTDVELLDVVPLALGALAIGASHGEILVAPVLLDGSRPRRARPGDGVLAALGRAVAEPIAGLTGRPTGDGTAEGEERSLGDHTNELAIVGERSVVKVFARTTPDHSPPSTSRPISPRSGSPRCRHPSARSGGEMPSSPR